MSFMQWLISAVKAIACVLILVNAYNMHLYLSHLPSSQLTRTVHIASFFTIPVTILCAIWLVRRSIELDRLTHSGHKSDPATTENSATSDEQS